MNTDPSIPTDTEPTVDRQNSLARNGGTIGRIGVGVTFVLGIGAMGFGAVGMARRGEMTSTDAIALGAGALGALFGGLFAE